MRHRLLLATPLLLAAAFVTGGAAPEVESLVPADGSAEVDAAAISELVVTFDRPMNTDAFSFCGGGPQFPTPREGQPPYWKDDKTCVLPVSLAPDHHYTLSLNAASFKNFKSAEGDALVPKAWSFVTLPAVLPNQKEQKALNAKAFKQLIKLIDTKYSYRDLRVDDWKKLSKQHKQNVLASKTTWGWATAVGQMLEPTKDIHMHLGFQGDLIPVGRRAIDPLFRGQLLGKYFSTVESIGKQAAYGDTDDGIGYLFIGAWTREVDFDKVEQALVSLRGAKALILDVRSNRGGDELLAKRVAAWFVEGKKVYAKNRYRTGKGKRGFGQVYEREIEGNTGDDRFDGPVVLLTSRYVMSSCEAFVLMMRQAEDCTVVGQVTYGSSGFPKRHDLPNGVTITMPSWQALRPDGSCFEGEGLAPDVQVDVDPDVLTQRDPILERALELLRQR